MAASIVAHLRALANPRDAEGQRRFGITPGVELLGIRAPVLRAIARAHRRNHALALELCIGRNCPTKFLLNSSHLSGASRSTSAIS
jgi:hypothetical protein